MAPSFSSLVLVLVVMIVTGHHSTTATPISASCPVDVCFAIDRHNSITTLDWQFMLNFVAGVSNWLDIENTENQMALVSFDEIATVDIQFNYHATNIALTEDIRGQVHGGGHRSLDAGLYRMRSVAFQPSNGDNPDVPNYAVVITNGPSDYDSAMIEATLLHNANVTIIAIGVGPDIDYRLLNDISGGNVIKVNSFEGLLDISNIAMKWTMENICPIENVGQYPDLTISPRISAPIVVDDQTFQFECSISVEASHNSSVRYSVQFMFDGSPAPVEPIEVSAPNSKAILDGKALIGHMDKTVGCQIQSYWSSSPDVKSPWKLSINSYFAGLKVVIDKKTISDSNVNGLPQATRISLIPTIPIQCGAEHVGTCDLEYSVTAHERFVIAQAPADVTHKLCSVKIPSVSWSNGSDPSRSGGVELVVQARRYPYRVTAGTITGLVNIEPKPKELAVLSTQQSTTAWDNDTSKKAEVDLVSTGEAGGKCTSWTDPHNTVFDKYTGSAYGAHDDFMDLGNFWLVAETGANTKIQVFHEPCSWGTSYKCAVNCGVAVHSIYGHKKEVQMITRCGSHGTNSIVKVLKCQQEETNKVLINKSGTTYWIRAAGSITVTVHVGNTLWLNVEVDIPSSEHGKTSGMCGTFDGNPGNEYAARPDYPQLSKIEFIKKMKVTDAKYDYFQCQPRHDISPDVSEDCQCTKIAIPGSGIHKKIQGYNVNALMAGFPATDKRIKKSTNEPNIYSDDVDFDYSPPSQSTDQIVDSPPASWGTYDITEQQAHDHCNQTLVASPSYAICREHMTTADIQGIIEQCKGDIQILGDLTMASAHLSNLQSKCEYVIRMSTTVTDPENPVFDPQYTALLSAFLSTTCPDNCSNHGQCVDGECECHSGYIGADCSLDEDTAPTALAYITPAVCDVTVRPCMKIRVLADNLVESPTLSCKIYVYMSNGTNTELTSVGTRMAKNVISCAMPSLVTLGSSSTPLAYNYRVSLSNNGIYYQNITPDATGLVWYSEWMWWECVDAEKYLPKTETCVIDGVCYSSGTMKDSCSGCHPDKSQNKWTSLLPQTCVIDGVCYSSGTTKDSCYGCHPDKSETTWTSLYDLNENTNLGPWTAYSPCTKECDYGLQSRTRECTSDCCGTGSITDEILCNEHNCQELVEEQNSGLHVTLSGMDMKQFVALESDIIRKVTFLLNEYTRLHPDDFCNDIQLERGQSAVIDDVLMQNDTRTVKGFPVPHGGNISTKLITRVRFSSVNGICLISSSPGTRRRRATDTTAILSAPYMARALENLETHLEQDWSIDIVLTLADEENTDAVEPDDNNNNDDNNTLILAAVIPVGLVLIFLVIFLPLYLKKKNKINEKRESSNMGRNTATHQHMDGCLNVYMSTTVVTQLAPGSDEYETIGVVGEITERSSSSSGVKLIAVEP